MKAKKAAKIKKFVRERYAEIARQQTSSCCAPQSKEASSCCSSRTSEESRAHRLYSKEELESISANIPSLGCGNPTALSELKENEVVLDLGSGAGLDSILAAQKVGPGGRVIGLDMTPDMIRLARTNAKELALDNVEFRLGEMEHMPIESSSVDVVISNCVINLSPDKDAVFGEAFRVLKPGGRLSVSDIVTYGELPAEIRENLEQWAGCVAGALDEKKYLEKIRAAGFVQAELKEERPHPYREKTACGVQTGNTLASITVTAYKPKQAP